MDDLVKWLGEQLDEDAEVAHAASGGRTDGYRWVDLDRPAGAVATPWGGLVAREVTLHPHSEHIARHDPERVLREIEAKRQLVNAHSPPHECVALSGEGERPAEDGGGHWELWELEHTLDHGPCTTLRLLALPFADRPGYREEWRP